MADGNRIDNRGVQSAFSRMRRPIGVVLVLSAVVLAVLSLAAHTVPCDNADTKLQLAGASALTAAAAVAVLGVRHRWWYAAVIGFSVFAALWFYAFATEDYSCLN